MKNKLSETQLKALRDLSLSFGSIDGGSKYLEHGTLVRGRSMLYTCRAAYRLATLRALVRAGYVITSRNGLGSVSGAYITEAGREALKEVQS